MRIALVTCANIWKSPYLNVYIQMLKNSGVNFDIISWNRYGGDEPCGIQFEERMSSDVGIIRKVQLFRFFRKFVESEIRRKKYDKLIIFTSQLAIMLSSFLVKEYRGRYIIDYRDLSVEQNFLLMPVYKRVLEYSYANVVSSPGFIKHLPKRQYYISHNFDVDRVYQCLGEPIMKSSPNNSQVVLTIGGIRDYTSNVEVLKALANMPGFLIQFIGRGDDAIKLNNYAKENSIKNVMFEGYYPKDKEREYVDKCSFMNIYYPVVLTHSTAMSNRFYTSLVQKKPMIVTADSTQGYYVEKYGLGLSLSDCRRLDEKIVAWYKNNDYEEFCVRCNNLLRIFLNDYKEFNEVFQSFINN